MKKEVFVIGRELDGEIRRALESEGYEAVLAGSQRTSYRRLRKRPEYRFAFIDLDLAGSSGPEIIRWAREHRVSTMFLVFASDINRVMPALEAGAEDYLLRPYDPEKLQMAMKILEEKRRFRQELKPHPLLAECARVLDEKKNELGSCPVAELPCGHGRVDAPGDPEKYSFTERACHFGSIFHLYFRSGPKMLPLETVVKMKRMKKPGEEKRLLGLDVRFCFCDQVLGETPIAGIDRELEPRRRLIQARNLAGPLFRERGYILHLWSALNQCPGVDLELLQEAGEDEISGKSLDRHQEELDEYFKFEDEGFFNRLFCLSLHFDLLKVKSEPEEIINEIRWLRETASGLCNLD